MTRTRRSRAASGTVNSLSYLVAASLSRQEISEDQVAGLENGVEHVPLENAVGPRIEPHDLRAVRRIGGFLERVGALHRDQRQRRSLSRDGLVQPLRLEGISFGKAGIFGDLAHAEMIVGENPGATVILGLVMTGMGAPAHHGFLVPPMRDRKDPAFAGQAGVTDVLDETVDTFELRTQHFA